MVALLHKLWTDESGQGLVEYGLIIAIVRDWSHRWTGIAH